MKKLLYSCKLAEILATSSQLKSFLTKIKGGFTFCAFDFATSANITLNDGNIIKSEILASRFLHL